MKKILLPLLTLLSIGACGGEGADEDASAAMDTASMAPAVPAPVAGGTVTDPQIAAIVVAANDADIAAAEIAKSKGSNAQVKEFANRMITDHTGVNKAATDLVGKLGVTPETNPTSAQLQQGGEQQVAALHGLSGAEFDKAYIAHEVAFHQQVLDAIDHTLIPSAQNAELKALLEQTRPAVEAHLQHATQIQSSLGGR